MLKYIFYTMLLAIIIGLVIGAFHLYKVSVKNKNEMENFSKEKIETNKDFGKVLVIYYSISGHTKDIATRIQNKTDADIYEIKTLEDLPKAPKLHIAIKNQIKTGKYPEIKNNLPELSSYDIIFVGAPVWWYTIATPALSFLEKTDFAGKKVVPFSTQGSNVGTFFEDFAKNAQNAQILTGEQFNNISAKYDNAVDNKISAWLNSL